MANMICKSLFKVYFNFKFFMHIFCNNLVLRLATSLLAIPLILILIIWSEWGYFCIFFLITLGSSYEFFRLHKSIVTAPLRFLGILTVLMMFCISFFYAKGNISHDYFTLIIPAISFAYLLTLYEKRITTPITSLAYTFLSFIYIGFPFCLLNLLAFPDNVYQSAHLVGILLLLWGGDSGAYVVGKLWGKHVLFYRISPKKTWEGFIGGIVITLAVSIGLAHFYTMYTLTEWLIAGALISLFGTLGDLLESCIKRGMKAKDSSSIIPGHGGFLDRFDSLLMVIPLLFALYVIIVKRSDEGNHQKKSIIIEQKK